MLCLALLAAPMLSGCYGTFALTKAVYKFNGATDSKALQTGAFWLFLVLPVYNFAVLGDVLVLNVIEFWTGARFASGARAPARDAPASALAAAPAQ